jgi:hypothetical protein
LWTVSIQTKPYLSTSGSICQQPCAVMPVVLLLVLLPLPIPSTDGSIDLLRPYVNLRDSDFQLLVAWITAALRPVGPYPILVLHGEQGSAKSTLTRILRLLIDPHDCPLLAEPRSVRDLIVTAVNGWLLAYDNVSTISKGISDALCRLASGGGLATRRHFSNSDVNLIYAQRPIILNGIDEFVLRGDLIDRSIFLFLRTILPARRRTEAEFWKSFRADHPRILGGVLGALAGGLRELPSVILPELPRMADFARWGEAVGRDLGQPAGSFAANYGSNCRQATVPVLVDSPLATALFQLGPELNLWSGMTPTALFADLTEHVEERTADSVRHLGSAAIRKHLANLRAHWPKTPQLFAMELRRIAPQLRLHGVSIEFERTRDRRTVELSFSAPPQSREDGG